MKSLITSKLIGGVLGFGAGAGAGAAAAATEVEGMVGEVVVAGVGAVEGLLTPEGAVKYGMGQSELYQKLKRKDTDQTSRYKIHSRECSW